MDKSYFELVKDLLSTGEVDSALNALHKAVEKGDGEACAFLGAIYLEGKYVRQDVQKAKAYFSQGAQLGDQACVDNEHLTMIRMTDKGKPLLTKQNVRSLFHFARKGFAQPLLMFSLGVDVFPEFYKDHAGEIEMLFLVAIESNPKSVELRMGLVNFFPKVYSDTHWIPTALKVLLPLVEEDSLPAAMTYIRLAVSMPPKRGFKQKLMPALEVVRKQKADIFYVFGGYACMVDYDGRGAFELFSEGAEKGNNIAKVGLGYCYTHGIGTPRDYKRAREVLLPVKEVHYTAMLCLARIAMLEDPKQPKVREALDYLDMAEDRGFEWFREEVCSWLLWCKREQIELQPSWEDRYFELVNEGMTYRPDRLGEIVNANSRLAMFPSERRAYLNLVNLRELPLDEIKTPVGMFWRFLDMLGSDTQGTIGLMKKLVLFGGMDWDIRCEMALAGAFYANSQGGDWQKDRSWFLNKAVKLSQGIYDNAIKQCKLLFAMCDAKSEEEIKRSRERFLAYHAKHEGEAIAAYGYLWDGVQHLSDTAEIKTRAQLLRQIAVPFPGFFLVCGQLLKRVTEQDKELQSLAATFELNELYYLDQVYGTRVMVGCSAMDYFNFRQE